MIKKINYLYYEYESITNIKLFQAIRKIFFPNEKGFEKYMSCQDIKRLQKNIKSLNLINVKQKFINQINNLKTSFKLNILNSLILKIKLNKNINYNKEMKTKNLYYIEDFQKYLTVFEFLNNKFNSKNLPKVLILESDRTYDEVKYSKIWLANKKCYDDKILKRKLLQKYPELFENIHENFIKLYQKPKFCGHIHLSLHIAFYGELFKTCL